MPEQLIRLEIIDDNPTSHYSRSELTKTLNLFIDVTGVKAPKALVQRAQEWDAEIQATATVAAETPAKKK